ncbi:hypothetical protein ACFLQ1_01260 [Candidatus Auribacterota bacterium]
MLRIKSYILSLIIFLFFSSLCSAGEMVKYTTSDEQFDVFARDENVAKQIAPLVENLREKLLETLDIFFRWEKPAEIIIYSEKKWEEEYLFYFYNKNTKKENLKGFQTFRQSGLEEKVIFPAVTSLILSEIILREKKIKKFEGETLNIPLCFKEGLWRYIAQFNTLEKLKKIDSLNLSKLLTANEQNNELFQIKSAALVNFSLHLPYGKIRLRKIIVSLYGNYKKRFVKKIYSAFGEQFKNEEAFNKKWKEYVEAMILSKEYETKLRERIGK